MNITRLFEDAMPAAGLAGTGSLSDLGEPPLIGVSTKKKQPKQSVPLRKVSEAGEDIDQEDTVSTEDEKDREGETDDDINQDELVGDEDTEENIPPPVYGKENEGPLDQKTARDVLDNADTGPVDRDKEEGDEENETPKVSMSRVLQYKVFKPTTNRHADLSGSHDMFRPKLLKDIRWSGRSPVESFTGRLFVEANGSDGGLHRSKITSLTNDKNSVVLGDVTAKDGRYVFTTQITTGSENREFVFEGSRVQMEALMVLLKASMKDIPGNAKDIVNEVDTRVSPVEVLVNQGSLLTDGIKYTKQVIAQ